MNPKMHLGDLVDDEEEQLRLQRQRTDHEICQRFVRLSCHKMVSGRGSSNLRRNLLILKLLQKARKDIKLVPSECESLLAKDQPIQGPPLRSSWAAMRRSQSPRAGSPIHRRPLAGRANQPQRTIPDSWRTSSNVVPQQTPKKSDAFQIVYQAADSDDDESEKENFIRPTNTSDEEENVEELFLKKVGKSFLSPPVSPEKIEPCAQQVNFQFKTQQQQNKMNARRLEFLLPQFCPVTGRRDYFGMNKSKTAIALSDSFTRQIQSTPLHIDEEKDAPPSLFCCEQIENEEEEEEEDHLKKPIEHLVPNDQSIMTDSEQETEGETTEDEEESDGSFGIRFPSFKRRQRKRKPFTNGMRGAVFFVAEKRAKDAGDLLMLRAAEEHQRVPSISI